MNTVIQQENKIMLRIRTNLLEVIREYETTTYGSKFIYEKNDKDYNIQVVNRTDGKLDVQVMSNDQCISKAFNLTSEITIPVMNKLISLFNLL